jgi:hypothetical protein
MENLLHTTILVDGRCLDLLLTEDEIAKSFGRSLDQNNQHLINQEDCCKCWTIKPPPKCSLWSKILGQCNDCE